MVELLFQLHVQAAADAAEMRKALLTVADAICALFAGAASGRRQGLMDGRTVTRIFLGIRSGRRGLQDSAETHGTKRQDWPRNKL